MAFAALLLVRSETMKITGATPTSAAQRRRINFQKFPAGFAGES
jgi:hypothetical protein